MFKKEGMTFADEQQYVDFVQWRALRKFRDRHMSAQPFSTLADNVDEVVE
jgi:hypothetical protein